MLSSYSKLYLKFYEDTKEAFTSVSGAARICFGDSKEEYRLRRELSSANIELEKVEIQTAQGLRSSAKVPEDLIFQWVAKYNPTLLPQIAKAGTRAYLYHLAGYQVSAVKPMSTIDVN